MVTSKPLCRRACPWFCCCRCFLVSFFILGSVLSLLGLYLVLRHRLIFLSILSERMPLSPTSATFEPFVRPPARFFTSFWFFNVTNPDQVIANGARPIVSQVGPYVYEAQQVKENVTFSSDGREVFYEERKFYRFDAARSLGRRENDSFYQLDIIGYSVARRAYMEGKLMFVARTLSLTKRNKPFKEHMVREFLFGAPDTLLQKVLPLKYRDPAKRPSAVFGILVDRSTGESKNGSIDNNYTVDTGLSDIRNYRRAVRFNGVERLNDTWPDVIADPVSGQPIDPNFVDGFIGNFGPDIRREYTLKAFGAGLCSSVWLDYVSDSRAGNIDTYRFRISKDKWRNYTAQINSAMCLPQHRQDPFKCAQTGILNATTCKGEPVMMSLPHLLYADTFYQNLTQGLKPDADAHSIALDVDPLTGNVLRIVKRAQININLHRFPYYQYRTIPEFTLLPIMWIQESGGITDHGLTKVIGRVYATYTKLKTVAYSTLIAGIAFLPITAVIFLAFRHWYPDDVGRTTSEDQQSTGNCRQNYLKGESFESRKFLQ